MRLQLKVSQLEVQHAHDSVRHVHDKTEMAPPPDTLTRSVFLSRSPSGAGLCGWVHWGSGRGLPFSACHQCRWQVAALAWPSCRSSHSQPAARWIPQHDIKTLDMSREDLVTVDLAAQLAAG